MLDIRFIKENPELIKGNLKKKFQENKLKLVDDIVHGYEVSLKLKKQAEDLRRKRNELSLQINELVKQEKDAKSRIKQVKDIPGKIKELEEKKQKTDEILQKLVSEIPNVIHSSVPKGRDEKENKVLKKVGKVPKFNFPVKNHVELGESLCVFDRKIKLWNFSYFLENFIFFFISTFRNRAVNHVGYFRNKLLQYFVCFLLFFF